MSNDSAQPSSSEHEENKPSPLQNPRVRRILFVVVAIVLIGGALGFLRYHLYGRFQQSTNDAYVQADAVTVAPKVSGYVEQVFVIDNQNVKAGQPLVRIDPRDYRAQTAQFRAQIDVARANASGVDAQILEQRAAIVRAQADVAAARADAGFAQAEYARYKPLGESGAETREKVAELRNQAALAAAKLDGARAALDSARRRIGTLQAQVLQAKAQGEAARAQLSAASTDVEATVVRAAVDGRIGDKSVRQGQFVQAATRMMSVVPTHDLYIEANFKETQLGLMRVGQPVKVEVDALPGVDIPGRIASISPGTGAQFSVLPPQNATGNFTKIVQRIPVRIAISPGPETRALLVPGMSVDVTVDTRSAKGAADRVREEQERHNARTGR
ncbi:MULTISPECIES: HlyD family secretion protein [unclassified Sphingomonas]|uniref:HlyD family secretion protein n=1 Tax=unclassified Sphingomonas TaxID=196159 RepID=UPI0007018CC7|nr:MULTISPECIES: HlyD family secretion protein [unclassified Sphingomonas]KQX18070.1 multidrug ABC transporter permease [Sphingomonas sp. Root1294]KQY72625.1 multidrug ABC transporter permease [Sphingomonas sp. Root50]KRB87751.1 multidrug ABC transporter permease [Sphingomonas sp. Root720]